MNTTNMSPHPRPRKPQPTLLPRASAAAPIIDRAACSAWLRADCARDQRPAAREDRRGPIPNRRGPLPDRRHLATDDD